MSNPPLDTPVAFLIFNRPNLTKRVFEAIRQAKPKKLLVIADGARFPEEIEKCQQTRVIIDAVDWDCEILTNFSETNLGCKKRVSSGLDWVFSEVEEAIILEDDCLPTLSFFYFCQTLLEKYRDDERIMNISGSNFQSGQSRTKYSYYFSKYMHCWGWATWKRAWKHFDIDMKTWSEYKQLDLISAISEDVEEQQYWIEIFDRVFNNEINSWAYIWTYICFSQNGLSIIPDCNMVYNLGFGIESTHTISKDDPKSELTVFDIWDIQHPPFITRNYQADLYTFAWGFNGNAIKNNTCNKTIFNKGISKIRQIFKFIYSLFQAKANYILRNE